MAAKLRRATGFDSGHCFELPKAQMPGVGLAPGGPVAAEDIRNLQRGTRHSLRRLSSLLSQAKPVQRAHHLADRGGGHARVKRRRVQLRMAKQNLNHPDIDILLQQMGGKAMPQRMRRNAFIDTGEPGSHMADAVSTGVWSAG